MKSPFCHVSYRRGSADLFAAGLYSAELGSRRADGASWLWIITIEWPLPKLYSMSLQLVFMRSLMIVQQFWWSTSASVFWKKGSTCLSSAISSNIPKIEYKSRSKRILPLKKTQLSWNYRVIIPFFDVQTCLKETRGRNNICSRYISFGLICICRYQASSVASENRDARDLSMDPALSATSSPPGGHQESQNREQTTCGG